MSNQANQERCPYCGGRVDVDPGHIDRCYCLPVIQDLKTQVQQAQNELHDLTLELCHLTPGGSEYANDSAACLDYVRGKIAGAEDHIKRLILERNEQQARAETYFDLLTKLATWAVRYVPDMEHLPRCWDQIVKEILA